MYVYKCAYIHMYVFGHANVHMYICGHANVHMYVCGHANVHMYVCGCATVHVQRTEADVRCLFHCSLLLYQGQVFDFTQSFPFV